MKKHFLYRSLAVFCALGMLSGCSAGHTGNIDGYEDIDPDFVITRDEVEEAMGEGEPQFAQSVPYEESKKDKPAGDENKASGNDTDTDTGEESEPVIEEYLPGYDSEDEWKTRDTGSASYIWEPTVVVSIFVDEEEDLWTEEEREYALGVCRIGFDFIKKELDEKYNTACNLYYDWTEDPDLRYDIRLYESIPAYVGLRDEIHINDLADEWVETIPFRDLMLKYDSASVAFIVFVPHEGCSYSEMHCLLDDRSTWNEMSVFYLQDMYSDTYAYETPTVYAHELLHQFGAEDLYSSAGIYSDETYAALQTLCQDDLMLRTFTKINGVYTTFPDEVYGEISPITAYLLGIGDEDAVAEVPELIREKPACFPGSSLDRAFD